jgi:hypothetical protein
MPGLKYVFTKKKFIKGLGKKEYRDSKHWVDSINGNEVEAMGSDDGKIAEYFISSNWCKCIGKK